MAHEITKLIAEYREAYEQANGREAPEVAYARGYFKIAGITTRYTEAGLRDLRDRLVFRASATAE